MAYKTNLAKLQAERPAAPSAWITWETQWPVTAGAVSVAPAFPCAGKI